MRDVRYGHLKFGCVLAPQQPHQLADWRRGLCPTDQGSVASADPVQRSHGLQGQPHLEEQHMRKIREKLQRNSSECKGTNQRLRRKSAILLQYHFISPPARASQRFHSFLKILQVTASPHDYTWQGVHVCHASKRREKRKNNLQSLHIH